MSLSEPTVGSAARTVTTIVVLAELYPPEGDCLAVTVVVPARSGVSVTPEIVATPGVLDVNVQLPTEFEVGGVKSTF